MPSSGTVKAKVPRHIGVIPDGNRRWAESRGLQKGSGYAQGVEPGLRLLERCRRAGVEELSVYGFTQDNVKRPADQVAAFRAVCVEMAERLAENGARVRAVGDTRSPVFPAALARYLNEPEAGPGPKVNLLVNYGWRWDVQGLEEGRHRTADIPPVDLIVRWGGGRRLSGFLPIQSVYADFFVVDALWPDFEDSHMDEALAWYARQDRTLGG